MILVIIKILIYKHNIFLLYSNLFNNRPAVSTNPTVDPTQWKLEVEKAAPLLKIHITNDNKDWRVHLDQINIHNNVSNFFFTFLSNPLYYFYYYFKYY